MLAAAIAAPKISFETLGMIPSPRVGNKMMLVIDAAKNVGDVRVFWQGPSFGFDFGADGARTMMLVYSLPQTGAIFSRFGGINGSAYLVGGFGMTALTGNKMVVVPIRSGIGLRLGANLGWLKFTDSPTRNPF